MAAPAPRSWIIVQSLLHPRRTRIERVQLRGSPRRSLGRGFASASPFCERAESIGGCVGKARACIIPQHANERGRGGEGDLALAVASSTAFRAAAFFASLVPSGFSRARAAAGWRCPAPASSDAEGRPRPSTRAPSSFLCKGGARRSPRAWRGRHPLLSRPLVTSALSQGVSRSTTMRPHLQTMVKTMRPQTMRQMGQDCKSESAHPIRP